MKTISLVKVCPGRWVNPAQVCYVREDPENPNISYIGFHGGVELDEMPDRWSNELQVLAPSKKVINKLSGFDELMANAESIGQSLEALQ